MRRRRATVATPGLRRLAVANGPNIFQMLLVSVLLLLLLCRLIVLYLSIQLLHCIAASVLLNLGLYTLTYLLAFRFDVRHFLE